MPRATFAPLILALLAGCTIGSGVKKSRLAHRPEGAYVDASSSNGSFTGELLEVRVDGLVLLRAESGPGQRIGLLPYGAIRVARFEGLGPRYVLKDGQPPAPATRERLQRVSRFPQGLSDALLRDLLEAYGQARLEKLAE